METLFQWLLTTSLILQTLANAIDIKPNNILTSHHEHKHRHGHGDIHVINNATSKLPHPKIRIEKQNPTLLPLYPKNVTQNQNLTRSKRQNTYTYDQYGGIVYEDNRIQTQQSKNYVTDDGANPDYVISTGPWSDFTGESICSRTCGGGVADESRQCLHHSPTDNSPTCTGPTHRYYSCNTHACPQSETDFRAEQCSAFDSVPFEGRFYQWIPYTKAPNKCELNCMPKGERFYYRHKRKVIDGTKCNEEDDNVCVNGKCLPVGCDKILGSTSREDKCRNCGGDGSDCHTVQGLFEQNNLQVGYNDILLIPSGASNIIVKETKASNNYLAIRNTSGHFYLNGNWRIDFPRELTFASTIFHYERKPHSFFAPESLRALGPLSESIYIVILYQETNPGIEYEYSVPASASLSINTEGEYYWIKDEFSSCSVTCGGGLMTRNVNCAKNNEYGVEYVEEFLCDSSLKPSYRERCGDDPCPVRWLTYSWDPCSAKCGTNKTGLQYRIVICEQTVQGASAIIDDSQCQHLGPPPAKTQECKGNTDTVCPSWFVDDWSACSSLCGEGQQRRTVKCHAKQGNVTNIFDDRRCQDDGPKPIDTKDCYLKPCEGVDWIAGPWNKCSAPGCEEIESKESIETRQVYCTNAKGKIFSDEFCHEYRKPNNTRECQEESDAKNDQCTFTWFAMQWGECKLLTCSPNEQHSITGTKSRLVFCGSLNPKDLSVKKAEDSKCNQTLKYNSTESCEIDNELIQSECFEKAAWFTGPWSKCTKSCGGSRNRIVICMLGNSSTTDVKLCGQDEVVFSSEDCTGDNCGEEELMSVSPTSETEIEELEDEKCEPDYDEYYADVEETTEEMVTMEDGPTLGSIVTEADDLDQSGSGEEEMEDLSSGESGSGEILIGKVVTGTDSLISMTTSLSSESTTSSESMSDSSSMSSVGMETTFSTTGVTGGSTTSDSTTMGSTSTGTSTISSTTSETTTSEASTSTTEPTTSSTTTTEPSTSTTSEPSTSTTEATTITSTQTSTSTSVTSTSPSSATPTSTSPTSVSSTSPDYTSMDSASSEIGTPDYDSIVGAPAKLNDSESSGSGDFDSDSSGDTTTEIFTDDEIEDSTSGSGEIGVFTTLSVSTTSGPQTTISEALESEVTLPKCPPRKIKTPETSNCSDSQFGCCPDKIHSATGPFGLGCTQPKTCKETEFGCCSDGVTPAHGKFKVRGCPAPNCKKSLYGCCPDNKTPAEGNNFEACNKHCMETEHGCCPDGFTPKKGPKGKTCPPVKCEDTKYGCCPKYTDKPADGPNFQGCKEIKPDNCKASHFGCCIADGKTAALGPTNEGCPETPPCMLEKFGCCDDELTSAHGENKEGCCLNTPYGCCPDNIVPASGWNLQGCTCESSPYGCCPDNQTAARGPNSDCGCKFTEHGCCPDGYTNANGSEYAGCPCATFQLGCCPDGVTVAKGPNKEGCGCEYSEFGCCPDRRTSKSGLNDTCGCESSWFGCCPDGNTEAKGEDFEGCETIPIKPGDVCGLDKERGNCRNFTVKWFFDMEYGGCSRFWYGGCEGNANKFASQDSCKSVCVEPEGRDACYLPRVAGPCEGYYPSWHYDPQRDQCLQFVYGGCLGNNNRFGSREACENNCLMPDRIDPCDQPRIPGPCKGNYTRWTFNKENSNCELFQYGGCKGNNNNYLTEKECNQQCNSEGKVRANLEEVCNKKSEVKEGCNETYYYYDDTKQCVSYIGCHGFNKLNCERFCRHNFFYNCLLPQQPGPCGEKLARWHYDQNEARCLPFYYGGCQGNGNRFATLDECEQNCPTALLSDNTCVQPPAIGECASYTERYHFDPYEGLCKAFVWSGCGGNANNFLSIDDCRNKCEHSTQPIITSTQEFNSAHCFRAPPEGSECYLSADPSSTSVKFFYDSQDGVCKQFRFYANCKEQEMTMNKFESRQDCEDKCGQAQDTCSLPQIPGPCSGTFPQYYYDIESDTCTQFNYGGCQGNGNRFDTITQCEQRCVKQTQPEYAPPPRVEEEETGRETEEEYQRRRQQEEEEYQRRVEEDQIRRQAYEEEIRRRQMADIENQRETEEFDRDEDREPEPERVPEIDRPLDQTQICNLPFEIGPCRASVPSFYYDSRTGKCQAFIYGGCNGNANRFETEEMCERQCGQFKGQDICAIANADPGPCRARIQKYYFDPASRSCNEFSYGGCAGNGNRFSTREECEAVCHSKTETLTVNDTISAAAICRLSVESGPCVEGYKRWYYDFEQNSCLAFSFGGCSGNLNNFRSFESCINYCQKALQYEYRPTGNAKHSSRQANFHYPENALDCTDQIANCQTLQCPYGIIEENSNSCPTCTCNDPCRNTRCQDNEQCAVDIDNAPTYNQPTSFIPVCRLTQKPGTCPILKPSRFGLCEQECNKDSDCTSSYKCCSNGCGTSCLQPVAEVSEDNVYDPRSAGPKILSTNNEVVAEEGSLANLECLCRGNPAPFIVWRFNSDVINGESGRFRILQDGSVLQIIGVQKREHEGKYSCTADNGIGRPANLDINLVVTDPTPSAASILSPEIDPSITVNLGTSANIRCFALGFPKPSITWWRGERMLPFSSERFEQMRDYSLLIRLVSLRDLGPYTCQAYNGLGKAASWTVTVNTIGPVQSSGAAEDNEYLQYVLSAPKRPFYGGRVPVRPVTTSTTVKSVQKIEQPIIPNYLVPLRASINLERTLYPLGSSISIPCEIEGYPPPTVHFYHEDVPISNSHRIRLVDNELRITNASVDDSGTYRCDAVNDFGAANAATTINVEGTYLHPNCSDNSFFANCKLIVKANYCTNKYYSRFCCKSCTLAGQLPPYGPHLQEYGQAYFSRGPTELYNPPQSQSSNNLNEMNPVS